MDSHNVFLSNTSSHRQSSDTEMSSSCATSTASAADETDIRYTFQETLQSLRDISGVDHTTNLNQTRVKSNGNHVGCNSSWVRLNVGGKIFQTTRSTLMREPGSFLYRLCQEEMGLPTDKDHTGAYLIDRDPDFFSPILNYLRHGKLILNPGLSEEGILAEADFYNLPMLSQLLMDRIQDRENSLKDSTNKFVYRVLQCHEEELASVVSAMTDGWKIVQVVPINSNFSAYTAEQPQEYLCIVERECPDNGGMLEGQDRAKLLQQRARHSCNESRTSFFVTDNASLKSENFIVYKDTSEEDCLKTCSHNMDQFKRPISCESFTYDHASFSCTIFKDKAVPAGSGKIETVLGKRYFEKICLKQDIPSTCGQSQFMRVDQSVLVGYAFNMTLTDSIESCVTQCIQENDCKSAMYFYQDGECITNKESALTKPTGFTKEEDDRVVYFQNGCNGEAALPPKMTNGDQPSDVSIEPESIPDEDDTKPEVNIQISETTPKPVNNNDKSLEGETSDEKNEQFSEEYEESTGESAEIESTTNKFTSIETTETTPQKSELELSKDESRNKEKTLIQKKITKHPRNFGSKTYEILKKQETSKQVKNVANEIENPIEAETMQEKEATYFSEWSDWTPCTKSQERQVRRRRCLNLRKCLGALMQVQSCPDLVPTSTPQNNLSIRSIVSVDGEEYDDPITVDNISVESVPSRLLPLLNEQVWGPWQGSCQQFASSQPCNAGSMIGFESRECIAKNPTQCEGPFFRYCTLNC